MDNINFRDGEKVQRYIVLEGEAMVLSELEELPLPETYGVDWIAVEAEDEADACRQAALFFAGKHPRRQVLGYQGVSPYDREKILNAKA